MIFFINARNCLFEVRVLWFKFSDFYPKSSKAFAKNKNSGSLLKSFKNFGDFRKIVIIYLSI